MRREDLFNAIGMVDDQRLARCEQRIEPSAIIRKEDSSMKTDHKIPKMWLIAAIIAAMVFMMGCAIVYVLSIEDMAFGDKEQEYYDGSSENVTLLSLQGIAGTPGYEASKEWYEWLETYDTDDAIRYSEEAFSEDFVDDYYAYSLYTREMKEKLDEICAKYDLELLGKMYNDPDVDAGFEALQIQSILRPDTQAETDFDNIRYYANGSFDLEGYIQLPGYGKHIVSFSGHHKDAFTELYHVIGPAETREEWNYTTSYGVNVLMVIDHGGVRDHAFMVANTEQYVLCFSIYEFEDMPVPSREELEAYAEAFDFAVAPKPVSEEDMQAAAERLEAFNAQLEAEKNYYMGFRFNMETKIWTPPTEYADSFDRYVTYIREHAAVENQYYTLLDLDGDGTEELLWGTRDGHLYEVAVIQDGVVTLRFDDYLCAGNVLLRKVTNDEYIRGGNVLEEGCTSFEYSTLAETIVKIYYLPVTDQWIEARPGQADQVISEAEAEEIMGQYPRAELDMKPISEYPVQ